MSTEGFVLNSKDILPLILRNIQSKIHIISCKLVCKRWYACLKGPLKILWYDLMQIANEKEAYFFYKLIKKNQFANIYDDDDAWDNWQNWKARFIEKAFLFHNSVLLRLYLRNDQKTLRYNHCKSVLLFVCCKHIHDVWWIKQHFFDTVSVEVIRTFLSEYEDAKLCTNWYSIIYENFEIDQQGMVKMFTRLREDDNREGLKYFQDVKLANSIYKNKRLKK